MSAANNILSVQHLTIGFDNKGKEDFIAVNDLSFHLKKGEVLAIVGESGSGKSLTALAIMGLLTPAAHTTGSIIYKELDLLNPSNSQQLRQLRGAEIGMIFQEPMTSLNPVMKIGKQLQETILEHTKISDATAKQQTIEWLKQVQIAEAEKTFNKYPHQLSGGQKQRVMIAMAMCNHPSLLIADEPTTALDVTVQQEVISLMKKLQQETQTSLVFITHDLALASQIADTVLVMHKGKMVEYGDVSQIFHHPKQPYTKALLACKPTPEKKGYVLSVVNDILENRPTDKHSYPTMISDTTLLEVKDLKVWFTETTNWLGKPTSQFKAVEQVSFELKKGEILGLVGESGCGKSTLSKALMGLIPVTEGHIFYNGEDIAHYNTARRRKLSTEIQMIFQDPYSSLNPRLTIGQLLMEPMKVHAIVPGSALQKEALRLLEMVQLPQDSFYRYPHQFSGGQRQRIGIARALALKPKLLICDESVSALDVSVQAQILNLLKQLQVELSLTYLFISHDLNVVHYISDRVMVMQKGMIVEQGVASNVLSNPHHDYTKKLLSAIPQMK